MPSPSAPRVLSVGRAVPPNWADQETLVAALSAAWSAAHFNPARLADIHRAAQVGGRHLALPLAEYAGLDSFGKCNDAFIRVGAELGEAAVRTGLDAAGLSPAEARREAELRFGRVDQVLEECHDIGRRRAEPATVDHTTASSNP